MEELVNDYPTIEHLRNVDGNNFRPLLDKQACDCYLAKIMGLPDCDGDSDGQAYDDGVNKWAEFISAATDVAIATGNKAKKHAQTIRPASDLYPTFNYLCSNTIEKNGRKYCDDHCNTYDYDDTEFCDCETEEFKSSVSSYPSGHSYKAFMALLAVMMFKGNNGNIIDIMTKYCTHRNYVRAHWHSDVLIGKLVATMDIGYINGYLAFRNMVDDLRS
jgi:hypothetical protein